MSLSETHQRSRLGFVTLALAVGAVASMLDSTVVNVAVEHLSAVFGAGLDETQWVVTGFLLAMAAIIPLSGWLLDALGGRRTWMLTLAVFLLGSVLCGTAWNLSALIVFRIVQGFGAGLILPVLMTVLTREAGKDRLMTAMGSFSLIMQVVPLFGPMIGGLMIDAANWRWIFLINIPFCLAGLILAPFALRRDEPTQRSASLDVVGLILGAAGMATAVYGISQIDPVDGVSAPTTWVSLVGGAVLLTAFVTWSRRQGPIALIDVQLFRRPAFTLASAISVLLGFTMFGGLLILPLYFQSLYGSTPLQAGLFLSVQGVGSATVIFGAKRLLARLTSRNRLLWGFVLMALGTLPFAVSSLVDQTWLLILALVIRGIGVGMCTPAVNATALSTLEPAEVARGSATLNIVQRVGAPLGTTVLIAVLTHALSTSGDSIAGQAAAFGTTFWWTIGLTVLPIALTLLLPRTPQPVPPRTPQTTKQTEPSDSNLQDRTHES